MTRRIGLIGGIGPAATEVYYRSLVTDFASAGRKLALTIVHADLREMIANLEAGRSVHQAAVFAGLVDLLRAGGCHFAAVTSIGGHFCIAELSALSSLPLLSAVGAIESHLAASGLNRVGVLGTRRVMESKLYGIHSVAIVAPPPDELEVVNAAYTGIAVARAASAEQRSFLHDAARRLRDDQGVDAILLGGTDLSIAFNDVDVGVPIIDGAEVHAAAIAAEALAA